MDPLDVLDTVRRAGSSVRLSPDGRLVMSQPSTRLWSLVAANRALVHAVLLGTRTRHAWGRCDRCGEGRMVRVGHTPRCAMTPGCEGRHIPETVEAHTKRPGLN
jgi:hypothetical protein